MPRHLEYQIGTSEWAAVGVYGLDAREVEWRPPRSGSFRFRAREADALGELGPWGYSGRVEVVLEPPSPIYEALADGQSCPSADRGVLLQLWITPAGEVFVRHRDPFDVAVPDDVGPAGVDGGVLFASAATAAASDNGRLVITPASRVLGAALTAGLASGDELRFDNIYLEPTSEGGRLVLQCVRYNAAGRRLGSHDVLPDIEAGWAIGIMHSSSGAVFSGTIKDTQAPPRSAYIWTPTSEDSSLSGAASLRAFFSLTGSFVVVLLRTTGRCAADPANPWIQQPDLGAEGRDGVGLETIYSEPLGAAETIPTTEHPPNTLAYDAALNDAGDDVGVRIVAGAVSAAATGGTVYYDDPQTGSATHPKVAVFVRAVVGLPDRGAAPTAAWGGWRGPAYQTVYAKDGEDGDPGDPGDSYRDEVIWGASAERTLAANQRPLDSWTLGQVAAAENGIDRNGVTWAGDAETAGFGADKEYLQKGVRSHKRTQTSGAVDDNWDVQNAAHWGVNGLGGLSTRFVYNSINAAVSGGNGRYQFYAAGTLSNNDLTGATASAATWQAVKAAKWLKIGHADRLGWPSMELEDLWSGDRIMFEPQSSQWVAWTIKNAYDLAAGGRLFELESRTSADGSVDAISPTAEVLFVTSAAPRQPSQVFGAASYKGRTIPLDVEGAGVANWHATSSGTPLTSLGDAIKQATILRINELDEFSNPFAALPALAAGDIVRAAMRPAAPDRSGHVRPQLWAEFVVSSVRHVVGHRYYEIGVALLSYAANKAPGASNGYPAFADVLFSTSEDAQPDPSSLTVLVDPIAHQTASAENRSVNYRAEVGGALAATESQLAALVFRARTSVDSTIRGAGDDATLDYYPSQPVRTGNVLAGRVNLPASVGAPTVVLVEVQAIKDRTETEEGKVARENEQFVLRPGAGGGGTTTLGALGFSVAGGSGQIVVTRGNLPDSATGWEFQWRIGSGGWTEVAVAGTVATSGTVTGLAQGATVEVQARATKAGAVSDWSASKSATTTTTAAPPAPTGLRVYSLGGRRMLAQWTASPGGTSYDVTWRRQGNDWGRVTSFPRVITEIKLFGAITGQIYEFRVRAKNALGVSAWTTGTGTA